MSELLFAVREWRESSLKNPGGKPAFCRLEALEALNGFESSIELFVTAFNDVCGLRTTIMKELLSCDVAREQIAVIEDMFEGGDLESIVVVTRSAPTDMTLQIFLAKVWKIKDLFLQISEETPVGLFASYFERSSDVLQEMDVAELDDDAGVDLRGRETDGFVVIADERLQIVAGVLEFREELEHCLEIFRWSEHADGNVVRQVIDAVDERNLPIVAFHSNELSIDNKEATETFGIAVGERDLVIVRESIQFAHERSVGGINALADACSECAGARALEMCQQDWLFRRAVINTETCTAILAPISL